MTLRVRDSHSHISAEAASGAKREVVSLELDGSPMPDYKVPLVDDRIRHEVRATLATSEMNIRSQEVFTTQHFREADDG